MQTLKFVSEGTVEMAKFKNDLSDLPPELFWMGIFGNFQRKYPLKVFILEHQEYTKKIDACI